MRTRWPKKKFPKFSDVLDHICANYGHFSVPRDPILPFSRIFREIAASLTTLAPIFDCPIKNAKFWYMERGCRAKNKACRAAERGTILLHFWLHSKIGTENCGWKMEQNCSSFSSSAGFIFGLTATFHIPKFCIFYGAIKNWGQSGQTCCDFPENPRKRRNRVPRDREMPVNRANMVRNGWKFGKKIFWPTRPHGQNFSPLRLLGPTWRAIRPKTPSWGWRGAWHIFPHFHDFS